MYRGTGDNWTLNQLFDVHEDAFLVACASLGAAGSLHAFVSV